MDQLITLVTNLLNLTKLAAVTIPGLLITGAFAIFFWPPAPIDSIPIAHAPRRVYASSVDHQSALKSREATPTCEVEFQPLEAASSYKFYGDLVSWELIGNDKGSLDDPGLRFPRLHIPQDIIVHSLPSVRSQLLLDLEQVRLAECEELENELRNDEKTQSDYLTTDLAALDKRRLTQTGNDLNATIREMNDVRGEQSTIQKSVSEHDEKLADLKRYSDELTSRLSDPGRLRPRTDFKTFVTLQTNQVVGFTILSIAIGVIIAPLRDTFFSLLSERIADWLR